MRIEMNAYNIGIFAPCFVLSATLFTSGCATAIVRLDTTPQNKQGHVFPATALDGEAFWELAMKGTPLMASSQPEHKNDKSSVPIRLAFGIGAVVDLPVSIASDSIMFPRDLFRSDFYDRIAGPDGLEAVFGAPEG